MKKALLIAAAVMFVASSVSALPETGYIGIFKDATHFVGDPYDYPNPGNTVCPALYGSFEAWIWCLPSERGMQAAEFAVSIPPTVVVTVTNQNPLIAVALGSLQAGISVAFAEGSCQLDWAWTHNLVCLSLGATQVKMEIIPHPGTLPLPAYQFANCEPGYPIEPCIYLTPLYLCWTPDPGPLGVEETNWGAIKSLF